MRILLISSSERNAYLMAFTIKNPSLLLTHFDTTHSIYFQKLPIEIKWEYKNYFICFSCVISQRNTTYQVLSFSTYSLHLTEPRLRQPAVTASKVLCPHLLAVLYSWEIYFKYDKYGFLWTDVRQCKYCNIQYNVIL
jgi:hypothetical protein